MARLQQIYREKIAKDLAEKFGYKSPMQVPHHQDHAQHGCG